MIKSHVLVIDTDVSIIRSFASAFASPGSAYTCTPAESPGHALQMIGYLPNAIVFINLDHGVGESLDFIGRLRKLPEHKKTLMIVYSKTPAYYQQLAKGYGATLCIAPPVTKALIAEALATASAHAIIIPAPTNESV